MIENGFTIKRASELLDCSPQNIYQQKDALNRLGYLQTSEGGKLYISQEGLEYLKEKRTETIKANSKVFNQVESKDLSSLSNPVVATDNIKLINLLEEQIKELKEEKEYWRKQTEKKDQELQNKNDYIQELNTKAFALLDTAENNKKQEEHIQQQEVQKRKGFFSRFFK